MLWVKIGTLVQLLSAMCFPGRFTTITLSFFARPNEGSLKFNVEFSPMASPNFEPGRPTENANELARLIERGLRETKAVDLEALCVLAGRKVHAASQPYTDCR